jgi:hypothetical protein
MPLYLLYSVSGTSGWSSVTSGDSETPYTELDEQ